MCVCGGGGVHDCPSGEGKWGGGGVLPSVLHDPRMQLGVHNITCTQVFIS